MRSGLIPWNRSISRIVVRRRFEVIQCPRYLLLVIHGRTAESHVIWRADASTSTAIADLCGFKPNSWICLNAFVRLRWTLGDSFVVGPYSAADVSTSLFGPRKVLNDGHEIPFGKRKFSPVGKCLLDIPTQYHRNRFCGMP